MFNHLTWSSARNRLIVLFLIVLTLSIFYMTYAVYGNWEFAANLRGKKLLAIYLVGISLSVSTISFQTLVENQLITPQILGIDEAYLLIHTLFLTFSYRYLGQTLTLSLPLFMSTLIVMVTLSLILFRVFITKHRQDIFLMLMTGMTLSLVFRSMSQFLQVMLDPNEYQRLIVRIYPSFANIQSSALPISIFVILSALVVLWLYSVRLDVMRLGRHLAISLGVDVGHVQWVTFAAVSILVSVSTALVGPLTFLGFIVANVAYKTSPLLTHKYLFCYASGLSLIILLLGQISIEHVVGWSTPIAVIIELVGGAYFIYQLLKERRGSGWA